MSSSAGRGGSPAPSPSPRTGPRLFVAGGSLAPRPRRQSCGLPCSRGGAGGRGKAGGTRLSEGFCRPAEPIRLPLWRTVGMFPLHFGSSCLARRLRKKLFNSACFRPLLPEDVQIGSPIRPLRGAPVWFKNN